MSGQPTEPTSERAARAADRGCVLILGATSMIARATATAFAAAGYDLVLAGRDLEEVARIAADLRIRHPVSVSVEAFDALATAEHEALVRRAADRGGLAGAIVAFGLLGDSERAKADFEHADEILRVNYLGAVSVLTHVANYLEQKRGGFMVGIASVAGDRGRASNYVYGSAKAGLATFLAGMRARLHSSGVRVVTMKPGYIDTRMTYGSIDSPLTAAPEVAGKAVLKAVQKGKSVVYVPGFWRYIMLIIRHIPEFIFKRMSI